jgi:hypothetical protein
MTALHRTGDVHVSPGSAFRSRHRRRPTSQLGWALRLLACGIVLGLMIDFGTSPISALVLGLGFLTLAVLFASFGSEPPTDS